MQQLHYLQMQILRQLMYNPGARFSAINSTNLPSDHFNYHLSTLIDSGMIIKNDSSYNLTAKGKEYANTMDTSDLTIEKQPKVAVMIIATKADKLLIQTRLKEPYYGFAGFITGKVRFGEQIAQTAARELMEEAGLTAEFKLSYILHEHVYSKDGDLLEDKIFHVVHATKVKGELISTRDGKNEWHSESEFRSLSNIFYDEADILDLFKNPPAEVFIEKAYAIEAF